MTKTHPNLKLFFTLLFFCFSICMKSQQAKKPLFSAGNGVIGYGRIEFTVKIDNYFDENSKKLVLVDSVTAVTDTGEKLKRTELPRSSQNKQYNNSNKKSVWFEVPKNDFKSVSLQGTMKCFVPDEANNSLLYFESLSSIEKNKNYLSDNSKYEKGLILEFLDLKLFMKLGGFKETPSWTVNNKKVGFDDYDYAIHLKELPQNKLTWISSNCETFKMTLDDKSTIILYRICNKKNPLDDTDATLYIENKKSVKTLPFKLENVLVE